MTVSINSCSDGVMRPRPQRGGKPVGVSEPMIVGAVFLRPHGVDAARHAEGKKVEKNLADSAQDTKSTNRSR